MPKLELVLILMFVGILLSPATFEFRNLECISLDETFSTFEYCYIKALNRSYKYMPLKVNLLKVPINKVKINWDFRKRLNGYKPCLYNLTFDACKFLKQSKSQRNPVVNYFYDMIGTHSNMNHTCPYDHDLILEKLDISFVEISSNATWRLFTTWFAYDVPRAQCNIFMTIS